MTATYAGQPEFLRLVIAQVATIKDHAAILGDWTRQGAHREAAGSLLTALCASLRTFEQVTIPQLYGLSYPEPVQRALDRQDIANVGFALDDFLRRSQDPGIVWPPPDLEPPAIVRDLLSLYDATLESMRRTGRSSDPWHQPSIHNLIQLVEPVRKKACNLSEEITHPWDSWEVQDRKRAYVETPGLRGRLAALGTAATVGATIVGLLQAPGAINDFSTDAYELFRNAGMATTSIVDTVIRDPDFDFDFDFR